MAYCFKIFLDKISGMQWDGDLVSGTIKPNIPGKQWHCLRSSQQSCESKKNLKVIAGKISQVIEFLCGMLLSDAEGSKAKLFLDVDKARDDMEI